MKNLIVLMLFSIIFLFGGDKQIAKYEVQEFKVVKAGYIDFIATNGEEVEFSGTYLIKHGKTGVME